MKRVHALITHPHTGTHLVRAMICDALARHHPPPNEYATCTFMEPVVEHLGVLVNGHYDRDLWPLMRDYLVANRVNPIIPVRDPLLSAISHHYRKSHLKVSQWVAATDDLWRTNPLFVPLDLWPADRAIRAIMDHMGLENEGFAERWREEWPKSLTDRHGYNSSGDNDLKAHYKSANLTAIEDKLPYAMDALRKNRKRLRPWLEGLGYRNLLWWRPEDQT